VVDLTHLSLFSGIGGIDLAAEWAGFRTVAFVEKDPFCQKVLKKHWPEVPIYEDVCRFSARPFLGVSLLTGGFPCQPYSQAGKRRGADDDRALWPQMLRCVRESNPAWVVGENVAGFVNLGLDACLSDLEAEGYEAVPLVIPACGVGAPHQRYRVFIVANAIGFGCDERSMLRSGAESWGALVGNAGEAMADAARHLHTGAKAQRPEWERAGARGESIALAHSSCELLDGTGDIGATGRRKPANSDWWEFEPPVGRVANGVAGRVDRLRALGNAVVPQQVYPVLLEVARQIRANREPTVERQNAAS